jgi:hypothetical protein
MLLAILLTSLASKATALIAERLFLVRLPRQMKGLLAKTIGSAVSEATSDRVRRDVPQEDDGRF